MNEVIDIVSYETGEIFAEGLCGLGSARRWLKSRGLTEHSLETDEDFEAGTVSRSEMLAQWELRLETHPQHREEIEAEMAKLKAEPPVRFLYVTNDFCPRAYFATEWIPDYFDPDDGRLLWAGRWGGDMVWTYDFVD